MASPPVPPWLKLMQGGFQPELEQLLCTQGHVWERKHVKEVRTGFGLDSRLIRWARYECRRCGRKELRVT